MDCVRYFPDMLQEATDIMTEKEIRLRTPLEELKLLMANKAYIDKEMDTGEGQHMQGAAEGQKVIDGENKDHELSYTTLVKHKTDASITNSDEGISHSKQKKSVTEHFYNGDSVAFQTQVDSGLLDVASIPLPP